MRIISTALLASTLLLTAPASGQLGAVLGTVGGSVLINQAGDEFRDTIDHAREAATTLLGYGNEIAKERLAQIDAILDVTVSGLIGQTEEAALTLLRAATEEIKAIEEELFADLKQAIWEAECAGKRLVIQDVNAALGGLGDILNTHQIRITPPIDYAERTPGWLCLLWCEDPYVVEVREPFGETYTDVRGIMLASVSPENISGDTPAHYIVGTYEYLSAFALKTSCFYPGSSDVWNREFVKYRELAGQWRSYLKIEIVGGQRS